MTGDARSSGGTAYSDWLPFVGAIAFGTWYGVKAGLENQPEYLIVGLILSSLGAFGLFVMSLPRPTVSGGEPNGE